MARSFDGSTQYGLTVSPPSIATVSFAIWVKLASLPTSGTYYNLFTGQNADGDNYFIHSSDHWITSAGIWKARFYAAGSEHFPVATHAISAGVWTLLGSSCGSAGSAMHVGANFESGTATGGSNEASTNLTLCRTQSGTGESGTATRFAGDIGPWGLWTDSIFTSTEWADLAAGMPFEDLRPAGTRRIWLISGDASPEPEYGGNNDLTLTGSPPKSDTSPFNPSYDQTDYQFFNDDGLGTGEAA